MRRLFVRDLRRLLPIALAMVGLGIFIQLAALVFSSSSLMVETGLWVVALATPWLLGVAAFAHDYESGGETFLATLPVSRTVLLLTRLSVATLLRWASSP